MAKRIELIIANNVITRRKARHLNQRELAEKAGVHPVTINRIENCTIAITHGMVEKIASALLCEPTVLYVDPEIIQTFDPSPTLQTAIDLLSEFESATPEQRDSARKVLRK